MHYRFLTLTASPQTHPKNLLIFLSEKALSQINQEETLNGNNSFKQNYQKRYLLFLAA